MTQRVGAGVRFGKTRSRVCATHGPAHNRCRQRAVQGSHVPDKERPAWALRPRVAQVLDNRATGLDRQREYVRTPAFGANNLQRALAPVKMLQLETSDLPNP